MKGVYQYCSENNFFTNKANARTHSIMSGGNLYVSDEKYDEFLTIYADEISRGNKTLTFSELRSTPVFRMYFDVDILDRQKLGAQFLLKMIRTIQNAMKSYYRNSTDNLKCVVCTTETKEVTVNEETKNVKNGYHIIYPALRVNFDIAIQLRHTIVSELEKAMGKRELSSNSWSDIIDRAPYNNGLKMCGSVKVTPCTACKGKKRVSRKKPEVVAILRDIQRLRKRAFPRHNDPDFDYRDIMTIEKDEFKNSELSNLYSQYQEHTGVLMCMECGDKGWQLENRSYSPIHVVDGDGNLCEDDFEYILSDRHEAMRWTSIRCRPMDELTPGYAIPPGTPVSPPDSSTTDMLTYSHKLRKISEGLYREIVNSDMFENDALTMKFWKGREIVDPGILEKVQESIRQFHIKYQRVDVKSVFEMHVAKSSDKGTIAFQRPGKTTKRGGHKSSKTLLNAMAGKNNVCLEQGRLVEVVKRFAVRVSGEGSTYCCNKGAEHTSNTCFFWISPSGVCQKCFSRKEVARTSGMTCQKFMSPMAKLPTSLRKALFPEAEEPKPDVFNIGQVKKKAKKRSTAGNPNWLRIAQT